MNRKINPLIIFGGLAAAAAVFLAARNKARAAQNLRFEPVDIAIDSEKTKRALGLRLYYRVKIRLINDEPAAIQVNRVNLTAQTNGRALGNLVSAQGFTVPANGSQVVQLDTSIASFGLVSTILDFIRNRQPVPINVAGFIDTDLGRVTVNYNTTLGGGIFGPTSALKLTPIEKVKRKMFFSLPGKKSIYVADGFNRNTKKYEAYRADDINSFRQFKKGTLVNTQIDF